MVYGDAINRWALLFREIGELTKQSLGKVFFWDDAATVCALHLPDSYYIEKETRLIPRRQCGLRLVTDAGFDYLEAIIGDNPAIGLKIELVEIQTDRPVTNAWGASVISRAK